MANDDRFAVSGRSAVTVGVQTKDPVQRRSDVLVGLQYLRAIAATGVLVFHAAQRAGLLFWVGEAGVDLFFLLSGFLMIAITNRESRPRAFLNSRILRIVPPYWIATTVMLAGGGWLFPHMQLVPWHVVSSYLFVPSLSPSGKPWPLLVPGWTLNFEMFFYLCFSLTMGLRSQFRQVIVLALAFGAAVVIGFALRPTDVLLATYTNPMLLEFIGGMGIGLCWKRAAALPAWVGWSALALAASLFLYVWTLNTDADRVIMFGLPSAMALIGVLALESHNRVPRLRLPLLLGNASYSIYLWHGMFISFAFKACDVLDFADIAVLPVGVAFGLVGGIAGYALIERPILKRLQSRRQRHGVPTPTGT